MTLSNLTSRIPGFHRMTCEERLEVVAAFAGLDDAAHGQLAAPGNIDPHLADHMIENAVATLSIPIGVATNMRVDGRDVLVPMATKESSVVAASAIRPGNATNPVGSSPRCPAI